MERNKYQNCENIRNNLSKGHSIAENRQIDVSSPGGSICLNLEGKVAAVYKIIVNNRFNITISYIYILKKPCLN
jgi:hypothetical protein